MEGKPANSLFISPLPVEFTLSSSRDYWGIKESAVTVNSIACARGGLCTAVLCGDHDKESKMFVEEVFFCVCVCVHDAVFFSFFMRKEKDPVPIPMLGI